MNLDDVVGGSRMRRPGPNQNDSTYSRRSNSARANRGTGAKEATIPVDPDKLPLSRGVIATQTVMVPPQQASEKPSGETVSSGRTLNATPVWTRFMSKKEDRNH